jgi:hypothetical protein
LNICRIERINSHAVESDEDSAPEIILDTDDWLKRNGNFDNPIESEEDCAAYEESDIAHHNRIENLECPEQQDVSAGTNVPGVLRPVLKAKKQAEMLFVTVNSAEMWGTKGGLKKYDRMHQWFTSFM